MVAAGRGGGQAEGREDTGGAWAQQPRDAELLARARPRAAGPAPPNGSSTSPRGSIPRSIVTRRSAASISASATRTMPSAQSRAARARARPPDAATTRSAASRRRRTPPARGESSSSRPSSRFASVTVGCSPAEPVTGRTRDRAGRGRAHPQRPARIAPGDRAAAGADGLDVERRQRQRPACDQAFGGLADVPVGDQAHVTGGAPHVQAQHVTLARQLGQQRGAPDAAGGARQHRQRGVAPRRWPRRSALPRTA